MNPWISRSAQRRSRANRFAVAARPTPEERLSPVDDRVLGGPEAASAMAWSAFGSARRKSMPVRISAASVISGVMTPEQPRSVNPRPRAREGFCPIDLEAEVSPKSRRCHDAMA